MAPGGLHQLRREERPKHDSEDRDHQDPANELREREPPAHQQREDDPELDHEVRRGELEGHRGGEVRPLAEDGARQGDRRVGTGRGGRSEGARDRQSPRRVVGQQPAHLGLGHDRLDGGGEGESEHEGPQDLPGHPEGETEGVGDPARDRGSEAQT